VQQRLLEPTQARMVRRSRTWITLLQWRAPILFPVLGNRALDRFRLVLVER
jgi:hypothetical protein